MWNPPRIPCGFVNEGYRLTYKKTGENQLTLDFDIAAPGKPFAITSTLF